MSKRIGKGFPMRLKGHEMKTLEENEVLNKKVPYVDIHGAPKPWEIHVKIFPDNILDEHGNIIIRREGGRIKPKRR